MSDGSPARPSHRVLRSATTSGLAHRFPADRGCRRHVVALPGGRESGPGLCAAEQHVRTVPAARRSLPIRCDEALETLESHHGYGDDAIDRQCLPQSSGTAQARWKPSGSRRRSLVAGSGAVLADDAGRPVAGGHLIMSGDTGNPNCDVAPRQIHGLRGSRPGPAQHPRMNAHKRIHCDARPSTRRRLPKRPTEAVSADGRVETGACERTSTKSGATPNGYVSSWTSGDEHDSKPLSSMPHR
jgi:hypothetical protein